MAKISESGGLTPISPPPPFVPPVLPPPQPGPAPVPAATPAAPISVVPPKVLTDLAQYLSDPLVREGYRNNLGSVPIIDPILRFGSDVAEQVFPPFFAQRQQTIDPATGKPLEDPTIPPILPGIGVAAGISQKAGRTAEAQAGRVVPDLVKAVQETPGFLKTAEQKIAERAISTSEKPTFGFGGFSPDVQPTLGALQNAGQEAIAQARPVISRAESAAQAASMNKPVWELAKSVPEPGDLTATLQRLRTETQDIIASTADYRAKIDAGTITPEERALYRAKLQEALFGRVKEIQGRSEAARATGDAAASVVKGARNATSETLDAIFSRVAKDHPEKIDEFASRLAEFGNDPVKFMRFLEDAGTKSNFWDKFDEYYRANVLWNPQTHETNFVSGLYQQALLALRAIGEPISEAVLTLGGKTRPREAYFGEIIPALKGWARGYVSAFDMIPDALRGALPSTDKFGGAAGRIPGPLGRFIRTPFRLLTAADLLQTEPMYNGLLWRNAYREGLKRNLAGNELDRFARSLVERRADFISEPARRMAEQYALHGTSDIAGLIAQLRDKVPFLRPVVLFINTPLNLQKIGARYSPLGVGRLLFEGEKRDPKLILGEAAIGSGIVAGFSMMLGADNATGLLPRSDAERAAWDAEGRTALSIRASEYPMLGPLFRAIWPDAERRWVTAALLGPLLTPFLTAATFDEVMRGDPKMPLEEKAMIASANAGKTLLQQVPLFSIYSQINSALSSPAGASQLAANLLKPLIPAETLIATVERLTDSVKRDTKGFADTLKAVFPVLAGTVPPAQDVLGRDITAGTGKDALLPRSTVETSSPVIDEALRLRDAAPGFVGLTKMPTSIGSGQNKIDLDKWQHYEYQKIAGSYQDQALSALLQTPKYRRASDAEKAKLWNTTENSARENATRDFAVTRAKSAQGEDVVRWARAATANGTNYEKATAAARMADVMTPDQVARFDAARTQPDPKKPGYQLSYTELVTGKQMVDQYLRRPEFVIGDKAMWDNAARLREQYLILRDSLPKKAPGVYDPQVYKFYSDPQHTDLARLYEVDGSRRPALIDPVRRSIERQDLWSYFRSSAQDSEKASRR